MDELLPGDKVRVKALYAIGTIVRVSTHMRRSPYLVHIDGYGCRAYGANELEKLPTSTMMTQPPPSALVVP